MSQPNPYAFPAAPYEANGHVTYPEGMTRAEVHQIINDTSPQSDEFGDESELINDLGFDGLDFVTLALAFEDEFGIDVTDEQIRHCETVGERGERGECG